MTFASKFLFAFVVVQNSRGVNAANGHCRCGWAWKLGKKGEKCANYKEIPGRNGGCRFGTRPRPDTQLSEVKLYKRSSLTANFIRDPAAFGVLRRELPWETTQRLADARQETTPAPGLYTRQSARFRSTYASRPNGESQSVWERMEADQQAWVRQRRAQA